MRTIICLLFVIALGSCVSDMDMEDAVVRHPKEVIESEGVKVEIYDFEGFEPFLQMEDDRVHVINFWATWCIPCVKELPAFYQLYEKYQDQGVDVLLVSMDFPKYIESDLVPFILDNNIEAEVIVLDDPDGNTWIPKVDPSWSGAIPATVIYSSERYKFYERSFNFSELEKEVKKQLNE